MRRRYVFKTTPYPHQVKALKRLLRRGKGALFMPMRSGKTKTAIDFAGCLHMKGSVDKVLVVCPKSVISVWHNQIRLHQPEGMELEWLIVNYEQVWVHTRVGGLKTAKGNPRLYKFDPDLIVADESHKIGNPTTLQSRELYKLQRALGVKHKVIMTGTPFHRNPLLIFGQFKFLDETVFGTAMGPFKRQYALMGGYGNKMVLKYVNLKTMRRKIKPYTFLMRQVPVVPPQHQVITYPLEESEGLYIDMSRDYMIDLGRGRIIEGDLPITRALRLSQIAGGRLKHDGRMIEFGREKQRAFVGLVEQFADGEVWKVVVFARFLAQFRHIVEVADEYGYETLLFHGGVSNYDRERRLAEFDESDEPTMFVAQVSTGALGIDLSAAPVAVFYSLPSSLVDYDQDCARIRRFKDGRTLTYYYLVADRTVEAVNYVALQQKLDLAEAITRHPDLLSYESTG